MKQLCQCAAFRRVSDWMRRLSRYELRATAKADLALYADRDTTEPEHTHTMECSLAQNLWTMAAIVGAIALLCALTRKICSLF